MYGFNTKGVTNLLQMRSIAVVKLETEEEESRRRRSKCFSLGSADSDHPTGDQTHQRPTARGPGCGS